MSFGLLEQLFPSTEYVWKYSLYGTYIDLHAMSASLMTNAFKILGKGPRIDLPNRMDLCLYITLCGERKTFKFNEYT